MADEPKIHLIQSQEIKEYIELTSDDDYYTEIDTKCVDKVLEIEKKAEIFDAIVKEFELLPYQIEMLKKLADNKYEKPYIIFSRCHGRKMFTDAYKKLIGKIEYSDVDVSNKSLSFVSDLIVNLVAI